MAVTREEDNDAILKFQGGVAKGIYIRMKPNTFCKSLG
jgi:hypothetical protein